MVATKKISVLLLITGLFLVSHFKATSQSCLLTPPYQENFEGLGFGVPSTLLDTGQIPSCWKRESVNDYFWTPYTGKSFSLASGPSADHTTGLGKYLMLRIELNTAVPMPNSNYLLSSFIDLSSAVNPELSFWYHMYGVGIDSLSVAVVRGNSDTVILVQRGQQQLSGNSNWKEAILDLSFFVGDTIQLRFKGYAGTVDADISIDDLQVMEKPACPKPQNLVANGVGADTIALSWLSGGANAWQLEFGLKGFIPGTGTIINVTSNPFVLRNLGSATDYDIYVRDSCGAISVSTWSGPHSVSTLCGVTLAPFYEDFDGNNFKISTSYSDPGQIDICWSRSPTGVFHWRPGKNSTSNIISGPDGDHTSGNGNYMHCDDIFGSTNATANVKIEKISLVGITAPQLRFWYHMYGLDISSLRVQVRTDSNSTWTTLNTINGQQHSSTGAAWLEKVISLAGYVNDTIEIRFVGARTQTNVAAPADIAIDDIYVGEAPTCITKPSAIAVTMTSANSITLSWQSSATSSWQIGYRELTSGGIKTVTNATSNPFTINGLSHSTAYELWVRDSCGISDIGLWEGAIIGFTDCETLTIPYVESFDSQKWGEGTGWNNVGDILNPCWSRNPMGQGNVAAFWGVRTGATGSFSSGPSAGYGGSGKYIFSETSGLAGSAEVISPSIALDELVTKNPKLFFRYHMYGNGIGSLNIQVNDGSGWSGNVYTKNGQQHSSSNALWAMDSLDLTAYSGDTIQLKFVSMSLGNNGDIALDNLEIYGKPPVCDTVTAQYSFSSNFLNAIFDGTTSINADSLVWDFGDGHIDTSSNPVPHIYDSAGVYLIALYAFNQCGSADTLLQTIQVCDSLKPHYTITAHGDSLYLDGSGSQAAFSYLWLVNQVLLDSGLAAISYRADSSGFYNISLLVFNECGDTAVVTKNIKVCPSPLPSWTYNIVSTTTSGMLVQFDASASKNATSYQWDFGDGNTGLGQSPLNLYITPSLNYLVTLTITNDCGELADYPFKLSEIGLSKIEDLARVELYPNPAQTKVTLVYDDSNLALKSVAIINVNGQVMKTLIWKDHQSDQTISLEGLPSGMYWLKLRTNSSNRAIKLVVE